MNESGAILPFDPDPSAPGAELPLTLDETPVRESPWVRLGDIVMLYYPLNPEKMFVKRVIAKEGDTDLLTLQFDHVVIWLSGH